MGKPDVWIELNDLANLIDDPWCIGDDFNEILTLWIQMVDQGLFVTLNVSMTGFQNSSSLAFPYGISFTLGIILKKTPLAVRLTDFLFRKSGSINCPNLT